MCVYVCLPAQHNKNKAKFFKSRKSCSLHDFCGENFIRVKRKQNKNLIILVKCRKIIFLNQKKEEKKSKGKLGKKKLQNFHIFLSIIYENDEVGGRRVFVYGVKRSG